MHVPIVRDSKGETISADTSQTHEESQQKSPDNQLVIFEVEEILRNGQPLPEDTHRAGTFALALSTKSSSFFSNSGNGKTTFASDSFSQMYNSTL
jgi:hypothetical protein